MSIQMLLPKTASSISAKMSTGMARKASTMREMPWSSQPRFSAVSTPSVPPIMKDSMVVMNAMPTVLRAP